MRPIDKGSWPTRKNPAKTKLKFNNWARAIFHLRAKTGEFCHLCEMAVNHQIAVEHIKSKDAFPRLQGSWTNFLLSCSHCNSRKNSKSPKAPYRERYIWPHIHNTLLAFDVPLSGARAGLVVPRCSRLPDVTLMRRAEATVELYGLDKTSTADGAPDRRYLLRMQAIQMAATRRVEYANGQATVNAIVDMAATTGFFTVWFTTFSDVPVVKAALVMDVRFGLNVAWFNGGCDPLPRTTLYI